jgi:hypothetical protein
MLSNRDPPTSAGSVSTDEGIVGRPLTTGLQMTNTKGTAPWKKYDMLSRAESLTYLNARLFQFRGTACDSTRTQRLTGVHWGHDLRPSLNIREGRNFLCEFLDLKRKHKRISVWKLTRSQPFALDVCGGFPIRRLLWAQNRWRWVYVLLQVLIWFTITPPAQLLVTVFITPRLHVPYQWSLANRDSQKHLISLIRGYWRVLGAVLPRSPPTIVPGMSELCW